MQKKIDFGLFLNTIKILFIFNVVILIIMTLFRVIFFFSFSGSENFHNLYTKLFEAFFLGIRFDLVVISYFNILVTLSGISVLLIGRKEIYDVWAKALKWYYFFIFGFGFFILFIDYGFYVAFKERINILIFDFFEDDSKSLIIMILKDLRFPLFFALISFIFVMLYMGSRKLSIELLKKPVISGKSIKFILKISIAIIIIFANWYSAKGTISGWGLDTVHAEICGNGFINKLSLNGIITFARALKFKIDNLNNRNDIVSELGYSKNINSALNEIYWISAEKDFGIFPANAFLQKTKKNEQLEKLKPNVVLIVMESFGTNLARYESKDFDVLGELKKHFDQDIVFYNFLPAGVLTVHAVEALVLNIPQRPYAQVIAESGKAFLNFPSAATKPYKKAGYKTILIYGGSLNWRELGTFFSAQGFDSVLGIGSMGSDAKTNQWGVYDEYLFDLLLKELEKEKGHPKFIFALTTTNHPPYSVPDSYKVKSIKINAELNKVLSVDKNLAKGRIITYQYANQKLGEFITKVKNSKLGQNTIIAVTGDHSFWDIFNYSDGDTFNRYRVPFYLYVPENLLEKKPDTKVFGSHIDIMPTLYNLSLSDEKYLSFGRDMFSKEHGKMAFNGEGLIISEAGAVTFDLKSRKKAYWDIVDSKNGIMVPGKESEEKNKMLKYYKALIALSCDYIKNAENYIKGNNK